MNKKNEIKITLDKIKQKLRQYLGFPQTESYGPSLFDRSRSCYIHYSVWDFLSDDFCQLNNFHELWCIIIVSMSCFYGNESHHIILNIFSVAVSVLVCLVALIQNDPYNIIQYLWRKTWQVRLVFYYKKHSWNKLVC